MDNLPTKPSKINNQMKNIDLELDSEVRTTIATTSPFQRRYLGYFDMGHKVKDSKYAQIPRVYNATSSDAVDRVWLIKARQGNSMKVRYCLHFIKGQLSTVFTLLKDNIQLELKPITSIEDMYTLQDRCSWY